MDSNNVVIVGGARTPIGRFMGGLSSLTAPQLGAIAIREALNRGGVSPCAVEEVYMGNVVSAGVGQAPARQAAIYAGLPKSVPCTTINKVCASGMKSIMLAAQAIKGGDRDVMVVGGFESMSNIPHYLPALRGGQKLGQAAVVDGAVHDGLWDIYNDQHMGMCAEACADKFGFTRKQQDDYALESYARAAAAWENGKFDEEIVPVEIPQRKGNNKLITRDEDYTNIDPEKMRSLRPAFKKEGSVTAANASSLNDGACALVLASAKKAKEMGWTPLAQIRSYADAARDPVEFTIAPADATQLALKRAGLSLSDIDYHEINEAFSVVVLANAQLLGLDLSRVNIYGGAVALGHPIGMSGARIVLTLHNILKAHGWTRGCASICNGGGGASALVLEVL